MTQWPPVKRNNYRKNINKVYEPWMLDRLIEHLREGYSYGCFNAKYKINTKLWIQWTREKPELRSLRDKYLQEQRDKRKFCSGNI